MPLVLNDDVGGADANSYASVGQANALADYRVGAAAWAAKTPDEKVQALVTATREIDTERFVGVRASSVQALEWPRTNATSHDGTTYPSNAIPKRIVTATVELALVFAQNPTTDVLNPQRNDKKSVEAGDVAVEYFDREQAASDLARLPAVVERLLAPLVIQSGPIANGWGAAEAIRAS